mmetsp:Transcript_36225/g.79299  ORF Transcript_36225/g.79299 Transcript_36225/m.79299 type:complete len:552 (+) Transcript_36225:412-2067(+)
MSALTGVAISCLVTGLLSDRIGRKPVLQICMGGSVIGTTLKWLLRGTFWGFCGANFLNGLVSGGLPVALAYLGDVFPDHQTKQAEFGIVTGCFVLGNSVGGIVAILMETQGLFAPLWVGVGLMFLAFVIVTMMLVEPRDLQVLAAEGQGQQDSELTKEHAADDDSDVSAPPEKINQIVMWNIIIGAFADNVGSNGLFPLCLSPLAFDQFYNNFAVAGLTPVLSLIGYKWMSVMVALVVIPASLVTPLLFNKIGAAGGCVVGNIMTAVVTVALLFLGSGEPNTAYLAGFITVMYVGFPCTVISQLSTGPMLDRIAPVNKRGWVQGINSVTMNIGTALAPWVLGMLADQAGTNIAIWTGFAVSIVAALINLPLMWVKGMGPPPKKVDDAEKAMTWEDQEVIDKLLRGEYIPGAVRDKLNEKRTREGLPYLLPDPGTYAEDSQRLNELRSLAKEEFKYETNHNNAILHEIAMGRRNDEAKLKAELEEGVNRTNKSMQMLGDDRVDEVYTKLGQWFADHVRASGYYAHVNQVLMKQMILAAFPYFWKMRTLRPTT